MQHKVVNVVNDNIDKFLATFTSFGVWPSNLFHQTLPKSFNCPKTCKKDLEALIWPFYPPKHQKYPICPNIQLGATKA